MPSSDSASGGAEANRRRSQRVTLTFPVIVKSGPHTSEVANGVAAAAFEEETFTLVVNAHGALVTLEARVQKGETLRLRNRRTQAEQACYVSYVGPDAGGKAQVGLEFIASAPDFWGMAFPGNYDGAAAAARAPLQQT